jgi:hypothetical protein
MKPDPKKFRAPFLTIEAIQHKADTIREKHWPAGLLPVEVEKILWAYDIKVEPIQSLKMDCDVDALLRGDLKTIIVDEREYMDDRMQNRIRFSLAHEFGHYILHGDLTREYRFESIEEWVEFLHRVPEEQHKWFEYHAHEFAGRLLVPLDMLTIEFNKWVSKAEKSGFRQWDKSGDAVKEHIADRIGRVFGVSQQAIEKRLSREGLWPPKPSK